MEASVKVFLLIGALTQREYENPSRRQKFADDTECPLSLFRQYMHPYGTQQYQIESMTGSTKFFQFRQFIIQPDNIVMAIMLILFPELLAWFQGYHIPTFVSQPVCITTSARAYVQGNARVIGNETGPGRVERFGIQ